MSHGLNPSRAPRPSPTNGSTPFFARKSGIFSSTMMMVRDEIFTSDILATVPKIQQQSILSMSGSKMMLQKSGSCNSASTTRMPDLLSFDSWDYVGGSSSTSITTATSSVPSFEEDLKASGSSGSNTSSSSTCTVSVPYECVTSNVVTVSVSGATYNLDFATFRKLQALPWMDVESPHSTLMMYQIHMAPQIFEVLLNYAIYVNLPNLQELPSTDQQELETLALVLGFHDLHAHLMRRSYSARSSINKMKRIPGGDSSSSTDNSSKLQPTRGSFSLRRLLNKNTPFTKMTGDDPHISASSGTDEVSSSLVDDPNELKETLGRLRRPSLLQRTSSWTHKNGNNYKKMSHQEQISGSDYVL